MHGTTNLIKTTITLYIYNEYAREFRLTQKIIEKL